MISEKGILPNPHDLTAQLHMFEEQYKGKNETPLTNSLAAYLYRESPNFGDKYSKLFYGEELASSDPFAALNKKDCEPNRVKVSTYTLSDTCKEESNYIYNHDAIQKICHEIAPDYQELPSDKVPLSLILPVNLPQQMIEDQCLKWEIFTLNKQSLDNRTEAAPLWPIRIAYALQIAGLSWLSPDKNTTAGRIIQALELREHFQSWQNDYGVSSIGVNVDNDLRKIVAETLKKTHRSLSPEAKFYPKCYLNHHSPLRSINILQNQQGKTHNTSNDLKSIRESLVRILRMYSGIIVNIELPISNYPGSPHDLPTLVCPQEIFDLIQAKRPLSDTKLKDPVSRKRRDDFTNATDQNRIFQDKEAFSDPHPDQVDWLEYFYQQATKLRRYLFKTYKKPNKQLPDLLNPNSPYLSTIMGKFFLEDSYITIPTADGGKDSYQYLAVMKGINHHSGEPRVHYWLEIKGYIIDFAIKTYDENAPATLATANSRWHEQFKSVRKHRNFESLGLSDEELEYTDKITKRAKKSLFPPEKKKAKTTNMSE
ncbi:hypothetical protein [Neptuniibacter sp.]|uniref:hypothetical protein n=1 Tax=Neptuniibacter sp. TaxID=1962643 RepID=UPI002605DD6C|nr:hypothetical protein [Neptuniibacter sp.]MCP4595415.1 hypothetical protein [Neptuniibacter sp.]